jgi:hypothetical protein
MRAARWILIVATVACRPPGYGGSGDAPDAAAPDAADPGGPDASGPDAAPDAPCAAEFRLAGYPAADSVWLTGSFLGWAGDPGDGAVVLARGDDQVWSAEHLVAPGHHVYKFIVDATDWIADPDNPDGVDDGFGGHNSIYRCPS